MWASHSLSNRVLGIGAASGGGGATLRLTRTRDAIGDLEPGQRAGLEDFGAGTRACELAAVDARGPARLPLCLHLWGPAGAVVAVHLQLHPCSPRQRGDNSVPGSAPHSGPVNA